MGQMSTSQVFIIGHLCQPFIGCQLVPFDSFIPVDSVPRQLECFNVYDMDISSFCSNINPLTLKWHTHTWYTTQKYAIDFHVEMVTFLINEKMKQTVTDPKWGLVTLNYLVDRKY